MFSIFFFKTEKLIDKSEKMRLKIPEKNFTGRVFCRYFIKIMFFRYFSFFQNTGNH
jgi:hypothetical protein